MRLKPRERCLCSRPQPGLEGVDPQLPDRGCWGSARLIGEAPEAGHLATSFMAPLLTAPTAPRSRRRS
eukprot:5118357-Pyramimonas_sp.AAC.1